MTGGGRGKRDLACGCVHARANECKRGWWIWAREAGWRPRHTTREATRAFPMPSTTPLSFLCLSLSSSCRPSPSFFCNLCATRTSSLLRNTVVGRETVFPVHTSPMSVIVRFFSLSRTVSFLIKRKIGNLWQY